MGKAIKTILIVVAVAYAANFAWHLFTDAPSTRDVCYTWSKATDQFLRDDNGIDGAQWLSDNLKTEKDLENIDPTVLSALRLYDTGIYLEDTDPNERMGLRTFVINACEKAEPGSTKHS